MVECEALRLMQPGASTPSSWAGGGPMGPEGVCSTNIKAEPVIRPL